jgi:hypothetical protein
LKHEIMELLLCLIKYDAMKTGYTHLGFSWNSLVSPTSGGRSVGIVRLRTKGHGV